MMLILVAYFLLAGSGTVLSIPTVYDQRQSGKTNVRLEVKEAVIVLVGGGELEGDYDYNYDYSDLTIKPGQPVSSTSALPSTSPSTTQKTQTTSPTEPVSTTTNYNHTQNGAVVLEVKNNSTIFPANKPENASTDPAKVISNSYKPDEIPVLVVQESHRSKPNKFLLVKTVEKSNVSSSRVRSKSSSRIAVNPEDPPVRNCFRGYFLDSHNRCRKIKRSARKRQESLTEQPKHTTKYLSSHPK